MGDGGARSRWRRLRLRGSGHRTTGDEAVDEPDEAREIAEGLALRSTP